MQGQSANSSRNETNLPKLIGDERRLKQVIINLVRNAIKFTSTGSIKLEAHYKDGMLHAKVTDTGVGIEDEEIKLLFNRFGKLQRTARMNSEGLGLGLTIVQQIVNLAGGAVTVDSEGKD